MRERGASDGGTSIQFDAQDGRCRSAGSFLSTKLRWNPSTRPPPPSSPSPSSPQTSSSQDSFPRGTRPASASGNQTTLLKSAPSPILSSTGPLFSKDMPLPRRDRTDVQDPTNSDNLPTIRHTHPNREVVCCAIHRLFMYDTYIITTRCGSRAWIVISSWPLTYTVNREEGPTSYTVAGMRSGLEIIDARGMT